MAEAEVTDGFCPFWEGAANKELRFPLCAGCGRFHWYPMPRCPHCNSHNISWQTVDPVGTVYSWTVVHRAFEHGFADKIPYIVGLLEFAAAPDVRLISNLIDIDGDAIEFSLAVTPAFDLYDAAKSRLMFRPC